MYKILKSYVDALGALCTEKCGFSANDEEKQIKKVSYDSTDVYPGTIFICKGAHFKEEYLVEAIEKGAVCYVAEQKMTDQIPGLIVSDIRKAISALSAHMYDHVWNKKLDEIGITGTKGKSTTAYFIKSILDCYNHVEDEGKTALISGVYNYDGKETKKADLTTPETIELHKLLSESVKNGCDTVVMEVSSQGLKYKRVEDLEYKIGVFLNIGEDHISSAEHQTFEDYFNAKLEIFKHTEVACINTDIEDEYYYRILDAATVNGCRIVTFGTKRNARYKGTLVSDKLEGLVFELLNGGTITTVRTNIGGSYNMTNALAAIAVCKELGVSNSCILDGLEKTKIPGRMEVFKVPDKDAKVVVDYAHNEMSYQALFDSINKSCPEYKKLFMFGCAPDRAYNRRKEAGEIAEKEADKVVITKYDSGEESFTEICQDICKFSSDSKDIKIIEDREEAIKYCIDSAEDKWIVVMTGCEHDSEIVKKFLS